MRYKLLFLFLLTVLSGQSLAKWKKINDIDYTWGPFKIYNITLFTETGEYTENIRPLMLSLKYDKPVDGRDFAISIARSWANLSIKVEDQDNVIDRLRKAIPDLKPNDTLHYIALEDKGYFVVNDQVIPEEFSKATSEAILAIWLDSKSELGQKLVVKKNPEIQDIYVAEDDLPQEESDFPLQAKPEKNDNHKELTDTPASTELQVDVESVKKTNIKPKIQPAVPRINQITVDEPKKEAEPALKEEEAKPAEEQPAQPQEEQLRKEDPENPEKEIRPIEDAKPESNIAPI